MKKKLNRLFVLLLVARFAFSCSVDNSKQISPESVTGKWQIQTTDLNAAYVNGKSDISKEDVSANGFYLDFAADGTFTATSNAQIGVIALNKLNENGGAISSGKYEFIKGVLKLNYTDAYLGIPATLIFQAKVEDNSMTLFLDKNDLILAQTTTLGLSISSQGLVQTFLNGLVKFEYKMSLKRQ